MAILKVLMQNIFAPKCRHQRHGSTKHRHYCLNTILKYCIILIFQVLFMLSVKFLALSRYSHFGGKIPGYFWTWTDKIQISKFSWFPCSDGNPDSIMGFWRSKFQGIHRKYHHYEHRDYGNETLCASLCFYGIPHNQNTQSHCTQHFWPHNKNVLKIICEWNIWVTNIWVTNIIL